MYNRYIPQPDGSYRRNRIQANTESPKPEPKPSPVPNLPCETEPEPPKNHPMSAGSFLRQLIPKGLDTGDLLIILLLLLMAGDSEKEDHTALLTLALYLFL